MSIESQFRRGTVEAAVSVVVEDFSVARRNGFGDRELHPASIGISESWCRGQQREPSHSLGERGDPESSRFDRRGGLELFG